MCSDKPYTLGDYLYDTGRTLISDDFFNPATNISGMLIFDPSAGRYLFLSVSLQAEPLDQAMFPLTKDILLVLRKSCEMSRKIFAGLIGYSTESVARWERGAWPIPVSAYPAIRQVYYNLRK